MTTECVVSHSNIVKLYLLYTHGSCHLNIDSFKIETDQLTKFQTFINSFSNISSNELLEKYIMIEQYFKLNYNTKVNMNDTYVSLLNNNKDHFRYLCFRNIDNIKNVEININSYDRSSKHNETVFIEFRNFHHIEFNIRNMCIQLPNWKHTIICGTDNYSLVKSICDKISVHINIINISLTLSSIDEYSLLLGSSEFWNLLTGEHILLHRDDSLILDSSTINDFLVYDYIGAVWPSNIYPANYLVGNGGFSLRNRQLMITICDNYNIRTYEGFEFTKSYMIQNKLKIIPEDCFFVKCIVDNNLGTIAPYDKAQYFSYESVYFPNTIGCYRPWLINSNWMNDFTKIINKITEQNIMNIFTNIKNIITHTDNTKSFDDSSILKTKYYKSQYIPKLINAEYIDNIDKFILIIDLPNWGGGTTFFINTIVSYYKLHKTFIIIMKYNNRIHVNINGEYELNTTFDDNTINDLIIKNINKIEKIFINHCSGHSIDFLNTLLILDKEITTITHDMHFINDCSQPMINQLQNIYNNQNKISINKCNKIITQNINNLVIFNNHITDKNKEIIITNLPDYREPDQCVYTNNSNIVIGIIGVISNIKGLSVLSHIIDYYKNNNNVQIIVFGWCSIDNFKNNYIYENITELNQLLIQFKPNILIELSLWPETYSYTLTLSMITQLPIIYLKKPANFTVEDRLSHYNKAFPFTDLNQFDKLIDIHKQNYFYTIKPTIYFNDFWDEYFGKVYNTRY